MFKQGAHHQISHRMLLKIVSRHPESFSQFRMEDRDLIEKVFEDVLKNNKRAVLGLSTDIICLKL